MLDSGFFESQVRGETTWSSEEYVEVRSAVPHDILFSFDAPAQPRIRHRSPVKTTGRPASDRNPPLVNIVHGTDRASIVDGVRSALCAGQPLGIAIVDRETGPDLAARTRTVAMVRNVINVTDETLLLHVLGCGNPVVMAAYTMAGADTFDSLDWAQGAVDIRSLTLTDPLLLRSTGCKCKVCVELPGPDNQLALLHNLLFYQEFSQQLREMVRSDTLADFLQEFLGEHRATTLTGTLKDATSG
jgi:queuine/archaeosine tRNA-ribosyltransferase